VTPKELWKIFYIPDVIVVVSSFLSSCEKEMKLVSVGTVERNLYVSGSEFI